MKHILFLFALILVTQTTKAQTTGNVVLFTENGEKFTVILNGLKMNEVPQTNVKVEGLNATTYKLRVQFENATPATMDKTLYLELGKEYSYSMALNNKSEWKLKPISMVDIAQAPPTTANQQVIMYGPTPQVVSGGVSGNTQGVSMNMGVGGTNVATTTTVTEQTTTTTTTSGTPNGENVNMGVNVNGVGVNMNINVSGMDMSGTGTSTTTTTTTTTTSGGYTENTVNNGTTNNTQNYNNGSNCYTPMYNTDFETAKSSISSKTFEDSKLTTAKQVLNNNCLSSQQVKDIMGLFTYEETKLDFAKLAYSRVTDRNNYFIVNDAFQFESTIEELDEYIKGQ